MFKEIFIEKLLEKLAPESQPLRLLELGSGKSEAIAPILKESPHITYWGIEPNKTDFEKARELIGALPNVTLINDLAYNIAHDIQFDACFSLSTLEHVKQLEKFLEQSVAKVRPGGYIIHRYDLGHALRPKSKKEKFQVFLGNTMPRILPEDKFVKYVSEQSVRDLLKKYGAEFMESTYHQMPDHKLFIKTFKPRDNSTRELVRELVEWEYRISPYLKELSTITREKLFPTVCVWAKKIK